MIRRVNKIKKEKKKMLFIVASLSKGGAEKTAANLSLALK